MPETGSDALEGPLAALIDRGEQQGCLNLSEIDELVQALDLDDGDLGPLYENLDRRGVELRDDCGRENEQRPLDELQLASATACSRRPRRSTSPSGSSAATSRPRSA
jgi:hypothetical protein